MSLHERSFIPQDHGERWFAIRTAVGGEFKARDEISIDLGFEVYCPKRKVHITRKSKRVMKTVALTPNYIFVRLAMNHIFMHAILERKHVEDIIRGCGTWEPQYIPDWAISVLKEVEAGKELEIDRLVREKAEFSVGDWVIFMEGLLKGEKREIIQLDGRKRIRVNGTAYGAARPLTVLRSAVEKVAG
jgi:transcription antitermination factor NusG